MAKKTTPVAKEAAAQPYYLQRAHIKDFRSIRDAKVAFKPGLNIVIGKNGAGKSNLVQYLEGTLSDSTHGPEGEATLEFSGRASLRVKTVKTSNKDDELLRVMGLLPKAQERTITLNIHGQDFQANSFPQAQYDFIKATDIRDRSALRIIALHHGVPINYSLVRQPVKFHSNPGSSSYGTSGGSLFASSLASRISSALLEANRPIGIDEKAPSREKFIAAIEAVEASYLGRLLPIINKVTAITNIQLTGRHNLYYDSQTPQTVIIEVRVEFKVGNDWLPFDALSSGTQRMIFLLLEVEGVAIDFSLVHHSAYKGPDSIFLLEEPELGIHPHQLHLLLNFLREQSEKHQLIITTHSPQVLDMLREDELDRITICVLDEKKGTQFRKLTAPQKADARRYMNEVGFLSDYWRLGDLEA